VPACSTYDERFVSLTKGYRALRATMKKGNSGFSAFLRRLDFLRGVGRLVAGLALIVVAAGLVQQTAHAQELL
jgi:hypothetical protein